MGRDRTKRKQPKGCFPAAYSSSFFGHATGNAYSSYIISLFFTTFIFLKLQSAEREMPTFPLAGEQLLCSFCFLGVGPPSLKVQREQAYTCRAQSPRTVSAPHVEQAKDLLHLCFVDTAHFGCPSQLANCS